MQWWLPRHSSPPINDLSDFEHVWWSPLRWELVASHRAGVGVEVAQDYPERDLQVSRPSTGLHLPLPRYKLASSGQATAALVTWEDDCHRQRRCPGSVRSNHRSRHRDYRRRRRRTWQGLPCGWYQFESDRWDRGRKQTGKTRGLSRPSWYGRTGTLA